jgi:hypothetical protein
MAAADTALTWRCSLLVNSKTPTHNTLIGWDFLARPKRFELLTPRFVVWRQCPSSMGDGQWKGLNRRRADHHRVAPPSYGAVLAKEISPSGVRVTRRNLPLLDLRMVMALAPELRRRSATRVRGGPPRQRRDLRGTRGEASPTRGILPPSISLVAGTVRAVADEAMEDALARAIAVRPNRQSDHERLLFAIVDGLEDHKLTAPTFILRRSEQVLCGARAVARQRPVARSARASRLDDGVSPGPDASG